MEIQIKESVENQLGSNNKMIEAQLVGNDTYDTVSWSFVSVSSPNGSIVKHSNTEDESVYLNYDNPTAPKVVLNLSDEGLYTIKILAKITVYTDGTRIDRFLDDDGNLIEETVDIQVPSITYIESNNIELNYASSNEWV